jgi:xylan 1,4-beta-xylosidase
MRFNRAWHPSIRKASLAIILVIFFLPPTSTLSLAQVPSGATYRNPVIRGDYPDPSLIRVGDDFFAVTTSGGWEPEFPILHSRDLVNWETVGAVFQQKPEWAAGDFWAPEISEYKGEYYVYYAARKKKGPLCVAVAKATAPQGPWTDHGPLVCQDDGSIDAFAGVEENGDRVLMWKEDGNSRNLPTPIWGQRLSVDGTKLLGEKKELMRNDVPWESKVVEGEFVVRQNGYFYMIYAGAACCGLECDYAVGVARAKNLMGPWEKSPANPILVGDERWRCPGHGSVVRDQQGRDFFLFHSYARDAFHLGRQAVLEQLHWGEDGWPHFSSRSGLSDRAPSPFVSEPKRAAFADNFKGGILAPGWEWEGNHRPILRAGTSGIIIAPSPVKARSDFSGLITRRILASEYAASTSLNANNMKGEAGLTVFGNPSMSVGIGVEGKKIFAWEIQNGKRRVMFTISRSWSPTIRLKITERTQSFHFEISSDGQRWEPLGADIPDRFVSGWDGAVRMGIYVKGSAAMAEFDAFRMEELATGMLD